jgi:hypothetical protein
MAGKEREVTKYPEILLQKYPKAIFIFFSFLIKKRNKRNQERTPTSIFFGAHSAGTPKKLQFSPFVHIHALYLQNFYDKLDCYINS